MNHYVVALTVRSCSGGGEREPARPAGALRLAVQERVAGRRHVRARGYGADHRVRNGSRGARLHRTVREPVARAMVDAINRVGHTAGIATIAERVEDAATLAMLEPIGVVTCRATQSACPDRLHPDPPSALRAR